MSQPTVEEQQRVNSIFYSLVSCKEFNKLEEFLKTDQTAFVNHYQGFINFPIRAVRDLDLNSWKKLHSMGLLGSPGKILKGFIVMFGDLFSLDYNQNLTHDEITVDYGKIWFWLASLEKTPESYDILVGLYRCECDFDEFDGWKVSNWLVSFKIAITVYGNLNHAEHLDEDLVDLFERYTSLNEKQAAYLLGMSEQYKLPLFKIRLENIAQMDKGIKLL